MSLKTMDGFAIEKTGSDEATLRFRGRWTIRSGPPDIDVVMERLRAVLPVSRLDIKAGELESWDSLFISVLTGVLEFLEGQGVETRYSGLPAGARYMLELALKGRPPGAGVRSGRRGGFFENMGTASSSALEGIRAFHEFLGQVVLGIIAVFSGAGRFRTRDFFTYIQDAGPRALPIVSLVSFLVGLILAFVATVQLKLFGAQIYVANLVGIAMARDIGAMMCGIIMAGRTGATYAAQLGSMQVNEEIDALKTLGINPVNFLVVPRILALGMMMPLLCIYADILGIAGGAAVGSGFSDITLFQYINQTRAAVPLMHFSIGIVKCFIYGLIVALVGCRKGLSCGRSAEAVGKVTTSAVVTSIVWIIIACAVITIICYVLNI